MDRCACGVPHHPLDRQGHCPDCARARLVGIGLLQAQLDSRQALLEAGVSADTALVIVDWVTRAHQELPRAPIVQVFGEQLERFSMLEPEKIWIAARDAANAWNKVAQARKGTP